MKSLTFVTSNKNKAAEAEQILGTPLHTVSLELPEIQSLDLKEIVEAKVQMAFEGIRQPVFVDDGGLYIDAWNGFPGAFIKFLVEAGGNELLLKMLKEEVNRKATLKAAIGFHDGKQIHIFLADLMGLISDRSRGEGGWGIDPVFIPENETRTFAEMTPTEKNSTSHRRKVLELFKEFLSI